MCGTWNRLQDFYSFGYTGVYGLLGFAVSIFCATATVWFIRHNTISGDVTLVKAMLKFAIFLVLGNVINFIGQTTPLLFTAFAPAGMDWYNEEKAFNYVQGIFILLSLLPTPVLILIHFRPVRERIKHILCVVCMKKGHVLKSKICKTGSNNAGNARIDDDADTNPYRML